MRDFQRSMNSGWKVLNQLLRRQLLHRDGASRPQHHGPDETVWWQVLSANHNNARNANGNETIIQF